MTNKEFEKTVLAHNNSDKKQTYWNLHKLNNEQQMVLNNILENDRVLIKWITWSWKTEIYKHVISKIIQEWKQAILLVPEIALTPQLLDYFQKTFIEEILWVVHSKITPSQKAKLWHWVKDWEIKLIIWSRSALFMPFKNLWIICIDEQHEWTYKNEQNPRYRLSTCAEMIAKLHNAKIVQWTATPDFWEYFRYEEKWKSKNKKITWNWDLEKNMKYKVSNLSKRINWKWLPLIEIIDLKNELKRWIHGNISEKLKFEIWNCLKMWEQIILFLNQRWMNSALVCRDCWNPGKCQHCEVSMTYHNPIWWEWKIVCHYCGKIEKIPSYCSICKSTNIKNIWTWTQKIEKEIINLFPKANVFRADHDTTKSKKDFDNLYNNLKDKKIDILIWTQMIAKGFDLPNVGLVGVILADTALNFPDYKSSEKTFSLLVQVAGRAWRWEKDAKVIIQTFNPNHPAIIFASSYNFQGIFEKEIEERKMLNLPPFVEVLKITVKNKDKNKIQERIKWLFEYLKWINNENKLWCNITNAPAFIPRIANEYIWNIVIRWNIQSLMQNSETHYFKDCIIDRDPNMLI